MSEQPIPWSVAWEAALYGPDGFFRTSRPADHFRTSVHVAAFAGAIAALVRRTSAATVVDLGAGGGELLTALHAQVPGVALIAVERGPRPDDLPAEITWQAELPDRIEGLLIANEWLDNVPVPIVQRTHSDTREVLVAPSGGAESLGSVQDTTWLTRWWPMREDGERAEVGEARDVVWADAVSRVHGTAIAIDYGHLVGERPAFGTLTSFLDGREVDVIPDGSRDITAHVAVDSVATACGGYLLRQREALALLGLDGSRPPIALAHSDPAAYVRALSHSGEVGELIARGGLGDFWWIITDTAGHGRLMP